MCGSVFGEVSGNVSDKDFVRRRRLLMAAPMEPRRSRFDKSMTPPTVRRHAFHLLRDVIAADIAKNVWAPGEAIPTELELAKKHVLSLSTVRKALDLLEAEGMIKRKQGSGTFVRRPDFETAYVRFIRYYGSAGDRRMPHSVILEREVLTGPLDVTSALQLAEGTQVIRLLRQRIHEGIPVLIEEIWLEYPRFRQIFEMKECRPRLLYPYYELLCGVVVAYTEETITIGTAQKSDVALLGLEANSPIVEIARLALGYDDVPIEWRRSRGPASDFRYKIMIR